MRAASSFSLLSADCSETDVSIFVFPVCRQGSEMEEDIYTTIVKLFKV
jgi:hypothetical protein